MPVSGSAPNPLQRLWRLRLLRFAGGGLINLFNRLLLVFLFAGLGMPLAVNYALVHLLTFAVAFYYHSKVTFGVQISLGGLSRFLASVVLIRILDYVFVLMATRSVRWLEWISSLPLLGEFLGAHLLYINVLIASAFTFVIRYLVFTRFTFSGRSHDRRLEENEE